MRSAKLDRWWRCLLARGAMLLAGVAVALAVGRMAQASPASAGSLPPEGDVRGAVKAILSKPEYVPPKPGLGEAILDRVWWLLGKLLRLILRPIEWVVDKLSGAMGDASPMARWLVVGLLVAVLLLILMHIYYTAGSAFRTGRGRGGGGGAGIDLSADPADVLSAAKAAADKGDFRTAVSLMYQAALLRLDRAGVLRFYPSRTNWQYVDIVGERADLAAPFRRLTMVADRAMYSTMAVEQRHYAEASDAFGELLGALG